MRLWRTKQRDERPVPAYRAIGWVRGAPRRPPSGGWRAVESKVELEPSLAVALEGLTGYSHAWVVFALDQLDDAARSALVQRPPGAPGDAGVFALRTQARPNPIGITAVRIMRIEGNTLRVRGLDAIEGTPVLDLKPYVPHYDSVPDARVPAWIGHP